MSVRAAVLMPACRLHFVPLVAALLVALCALYALTHAATPAPARAALPLAFGVVHILGFATAALLLGVRQRIEPNATGAALATAFALLAAAGLMQLVFGLLAGGADPQRPGAALAVPGWLTCELALPLGLSLTLFVDPALRPREAQRALAWGSGALLAVALFACIDPGRALTFGVPVLVLAGFAGASVLVLRGGERDPLYPFLALLSAGVALDATLIALGLPVFTIGWYGVRLMELAAAAALPTLLTIGLARTALRLAALNRTLAEAAEHDALTSLANRRNFDSSLARELIRARRGRSPLALIMIDIDYFKRYNDGYGHLAGDACLRAVAGAIGAAARRPGDLAARYGGEEFALILPETDLKGAICIAEALQTAIAGLGLEHEASPSGKVSLSMGIACINRAELATPDVLIGEADRALYRAKAEGRARWISAA